MYNVLGVRKPCAERNIAFDLSSAAATPSARF
jgi:hypothetical protein